MRPGDWTPGIWLAVAGASSALWVVVGNWLTERPFVPNFSENIYTLPHLAVEAVIIGAALGFIVEGIYHLRVRPVVGMGGKVRLLTLLPRMIRIAIGTGTVLAHVIVLSAGGYP